MVKVKKYIIKNNSAINNKFKFDLVLLLRQSKAPSKNTFVNICFPFFLIS